jgi:hypothetical protein
MSAIIYKLQPKNSFAIDAKFYVGSTTQPLKQRLYEHKYDCKNSRFCSSKHLFEEYGLQGVEIVELERCNLADRKSRECHWIAYINSINQRRLNWDRTEYMKQYRINRLLNKKTKESEDNL